MINRLFKALLYALLIVLPLSGLALLRSGLADIPPFSESDPLFLDVYMLSIGGLFIWGLFKMMENIRKENAAYDARVEVDQRVRWLRTVKAIRQALKTRDRAGLAIAIEEHEGRDANREFVIEPWADLCRKADAILKAHPYRKPENEEE